MVSILRTLGLILVIVILTIVDSQFINVFYDTSLGIPGNLHVILFVSLVIAAALINTVSLGFVKNTDIRKTTSRPLLHKVAYFGTSAVQYATIAILVIIIFDMVISQTYNKLDSLLIVYFSHFWASFILGILSLTFS